MCWYIVAFSQGTLCLYGLFIHKDEFGFFFTIVLQYASAFFPDLFVTCFPPPEMCLAVLLCLLCLPDPQESLQLVCMID